MTAYKVATTDPKNLKVCASHRCWNHPDDKSTDICPLAEWETLGSGATTPCEWVTMLPPDSLVIVKEDGEWPAALLERIERHLDAVDRVTPRRLLFADIIAAVLDSLGEPDV